MDRRELMATRSTSTDGGARAARGRVEGQRFRKLRARKTEGMVYIGRNCSFLFHLFFFYR